MIFNCHFWTISVTNKVLQENVVKPNKAPILKQGEDPPSTLYRLANRIVIQSPMKIIKRITSTRLEYFTMTAPFFLKKRCSIQIIKVITVAKGMEIRRIVLPLGVEAGSQKYVINREITWMVQMRATESFALLLIWNFRKSQSWTGFGVFKGCSWGNTVFPFWKSSYFFIFKKWSFLEGSF